MQLIFFLLGILVLSHSSKASKKPARTQQCPSTLAVTLYVLCSIHFLLMSILMIIMVMKIKYSSKLRKLDKEIEFYKASKKAATEKKDGMTHDETGSV